MHMSKVVGAEEVCAIVMTCQGGVHADASTPTQAPLQARALQAGWLPSVGSWSAVGSASAVALDVRMRLRGGSSSLPELALHGTCLSYCVTISY